MGYLFLRAQLDVPPLLESVLDLCSLGVNFDLAVDLKAHEEAGSE